MAAGIFIQHKRTVAISKYPYFEENRKNIRYITRITHNATIVNSMDIAYKCSIIKIDNTNIVNQLGKNAQAIERIIAINGFFIFAIYPILEFSIKNDTNAIKNLITGTIILSNLLYILLIFSFNSNKNSISFSISNVIKSK